ncbi:MAG: HAMP domain-containing histidine kinase [Proteobacteria bacterium]|nr:MAG: HAMP domain-containing histidine kinase [Pseudomonadota bacterium]
MTFKRRIFVAIFVSNLLAGSLIIYASYSLFETRSTREFEARYRALSRILADTLNRLDVSTETMMQNAALVIAEHDSQKGLLDTDALRALRSRLGVTHAFIVDRNGDFIRSTNEDPAIIPNLFGFSSEYRKLLSGEKDVEATPMIVPKPERIPFKFLSVANAERTRIIEVGVRVDFLAKMLTEAVKSDDDVMSMTLYSPDGTQFGTFTQDGATFVEQKAKLPTDLNLPVDQENTMAFFTKVSSSHDSCAQCDVAKTSVNGRYYYILKSEVSKRLLTGSQTFAAQIACATLIINLFGSLLIASLLSRKLSRNIGVAVERVRAISAGGDIGARVNLQDSSEISYLTAEFDRVLDTLETAQQQMLVAQKMQSKVELSKIVAHNIRSPVLAIEMMLPVLKEVPDKVLRVLVSSVAEIKSLSSQLKESANTDSDTSQSFELNEFDVSDLLSEVVEQKRFEMSSADGIALKIGERIPTKVRANRSVMRGVLSNILNNAIEAVQSKGGEVEISSQIVRDKVEIQVDDTGIGMSNQTLQRLETESFSTKRGVGRGIGVAHARSAVESFGGQIRFASQYGRGTQVTIRLPACH